MMNIQQDCVYIGADCLNNRIYMHPSEAMYVIQSPDGGTYPIPFQCGDPTVIGHNGVTNEALIIALIDRITKLNLALYSPLNNVAIDGLMQALQALNRRMDLQTAIRPIQVQEKK